LANLIEQKLFSTSYTAIDFREEFKTCFPEFVPINDSGGSPITDDFLDKTIVIATEVLPEGIADYFDFSYLKRIVMYTLAHILAFFGIKANTSAEEFKNNLRNAASKSADGLSISYESLSSMLTGKPDDFIIDWLYLTAYGRFAVMYLVKIRGTAGAFCV